MNSFDMRRYEMLVRVREFGNTQADVFPPSTIAGQAFAEIAATIQGLNTHAADHLSGRGSAREGVTSKAVAREALREDLDAIIRTARAMSLDTPGVEDRFRPPRGVGDLSLLNTARAFARDAAPLKEQFINYSMPDDFIEDLDRDIRLRRGEPRSRRGHGRPCRRPRRTGHGNGEGHERPQAPRRRRAEPPEHRPGQTCGLDTRPSHRGAATAAQE